MAFAENNHDTAQRRQMTARAGGEARVALHGQVMEAPPPPPPARTGSAARCGTSARALDVPVPQMVGQLPNVAKFLATQLLVVPEPVVEVPKILPHDSTATLVSRYAAWNSWWKYRRPCPTLRFFNRERTKFLSSRFFLWTALNSVAFQETHF